ncbi:hypothetical protein BDEG_20945 [Batrachochytrium dendrobatidis JEL423]|uniref:Uncharacterized protein n=1 Tax=Batrachochytrium dendrobatidis (strain JEL423) TaxID=403673 RepID=A0A177W9P7_BATDL|nr:hypothetical protein BDEG_20945 [Batrachochytrium dendrobatidis JEL423]
MVKTNDIEHPKYLIESQISKNLPINTVYTDPKNGQNYKVVERKLNNSLIKVAEHYLGNDIKPIVLENIPKEMLKIDNPVKSNPNKLLKSKIQSLEDKCRVLLQNQYKSLYHRIKELLDDSYHETSDTIYLLHSGLVLSFKKAHYPTMALVLSAVDKKVHNIFSDIEILSKVMEKQHKLQQKLYRMIMNNDNNSDETKEIIL